MSHRKFEAPRHGHLGFLPKKRARKTGNRRPIKNFPVDKKEDKPHLTGFLGYKVGATHIVREVEKPGSKLHKKETVEHVTIIETPPMVVVGVIGYYMTENGLKQLGAIYAKHLSNEVKRRFYKNWSSSKKLAFTRYRNQFHKKSGRTRRVRILRNFEKHAKVIRVLAHTQISKVSVGQKKAHLAEIQVNGGAIRDKVRFAYRLLEKTVPVAGVFQPSELVDVLAITKGKGFSGVIARWGVTHLPRKTHRGLRKVACIGAWHPARVSTTVARAGQLGYFSRAVCNKKIYQIGAAEKLAETGMTPFDLTEKSINPLGGFPHYGFVKNDYVMIKGSVTGPVKRVVSLRKGILPTATKGRVAAEKIVLKFIDTSSKLGRGSFQTKKEKNAFLGDTKRDLERKAAQAAKAGDKRARE